MAGFVRVASGIVHILAGRTLERTYPVPSVAMAVPTDADSLTAGRRLATIRGCFDGCHGKGAQGAVLFDKPVIARIVAPNPVAAVRMYTPAKFATIVRRGARPDGRSMLAMPSATLSTVNDEDLVRIIAFYRSLPAAEGLEPSVGTGPVGMLGLLIGQLKMAA